MKSFFLLLLFTVSVLAADVKISSLPLGSGAAVGSSDVFPYVVGTTLITKKLTINDLINVPVFTTTYAKLASPTFTGVVTAPTFVGTVSGDSTGNTTITPVNHGVVISSSTRAMTALTPNASTAFPLVSGGSSANPSWALLSLAGGGTNNSASASAGSIVYSDSTKHNYTAVGSSGQILQSAGTSAPGWTTATYPVATTINQILYSSATNTVGGISSAATSALVTNSSSVPSFTSGSVANRLLRTDGTTIGFSQAALTTDVTGVLPLANGGTGQSTKASAFDALSPMTTGGDLIYGGASGTGTRLANGSAGQVLTSAGGTSAPAWSAPTGPVGATQTLTSNYTVLTTDGYINASAASFTITLYPASGNTGKTITIRKTDASLSNVITIDGNGSETIDGSLTRTINTQLESYTLYCDGTNWQILSHYIPKIWTSFTGTITGSVTAGTISYTANTLYWAREGDRVIVNGNIRLGTVTTPPTGLVYLNLPTVITWSTQASASDGGRAIWGTTAGTSGPGVSVSYNFNTIGSPNNSNVGIATNDGSAPTFGSTAEFRVNFTIPVTNWTN